MKKLILSLYLACFDRIVRAERKVRLVVRVLFDVVSIFLAYIFSLLLRFGGRVPSDDWEMFFIVIAPITLYYVLVFAVFGLYRSLWKTASVYELVKITATSIFASVSVLFLSVWVEMQLSRSIYLGAMAMVILLCGFTRLSYRIALQLYGRFSNQVVSRAMVVGAGETGTQIICQLQDNLELALRPVVAIDDDPGKLNTWIRDVKVAGNRTMIPEIAESYDIDVIVVCIPSLTQEQKNEILQHCNQTECSIKIVPGIRQVIGESQRFMIRDIQMTDLLSRQEINLDAKEVKEYLSDACVLVTGGGGSIGSELCRQIAEHAPKQLIIFDIYENHAYELWLDLKLKYPAVLTKIEIGSVRDEDRVEQIFEKYRPEVVFHAAAHKHVPLMENSPADAVKNNVFGTLKVAMMAHRYEAKRFVLISTDKAVNPTSVMGATKRMAENVINYMNGISKTRFVAVRFGNVLGSSGSVIPLFQRQIMAGGPVTVTDKKMTRYFMTIPEASRLVLHAGTLAGRGEIFILDMGDPVCIDDIARTMVRLAGFRPDHDVKIVYTGLRPGEKLHEELLAYDEMTDKTDIPGVFICKIPKLSTQDYYRMLCFLEEQLDSCGDMREALMTVLPEYRTAFEKNQRELDLTTSLEP